MGTEIPLSTHEKLDRILDWQKDITSVIANQNLMISFCFIGLSRSPDEMVQRMQMAKLMNGHMQGICIKYGVATQSEMDEAVEFFRNQMEDDDAPDSYDV